MIFLETFQIVHKRNTYFSEKTAFLLVPRGAFIVYIFTNAQLIVGIFGITLFCLNQHFKTHFSLISCLGKTMFQLKREIEIMPYKALKGNICKCVVFFACFVCCCFFFPVHFAIIFELKATSTLNFCSKIQEILRHRKKQQNVLTKHH